VPATASAPHIRSSACVSSQVITKGEWPKPLRRTDGNEVKVMRPEGGRGLAQPVLEFSVVGRVAIPTLVAAAIAGRDSSRVRTPAMMHRPRRIVRNDFNRRVERSHGDVSSLILLEAKFHTRSHHLAASLRRPFQAQSAFVRTLSRIRRRCETQVVEGCESCKPYQGNRVMKSQRQLTASPPSRTPRTTD
jgi:hypothetical protein